MPELTPSQPDLSGMNCLVTGASRGLGAHIAQKLWRCGASLLLVSRSEEPLEEIAGGLPASEGQVVHTCVADLSDSSAAERIFAYARGVWTRLDGLVNNAGTQGPIGPLWENDWTAWIRTMETNLLAPVNLCRLAIPWMGAGRCGSIVNISGGGATSPRPNFTAYGTSKVGLVRFSETLALEVENLGIRVNCVAPGAMNTGMLQDVIQAGAASVGSQEYNRALLREQEGGDPPEQAAELVAFLISGSSAGITGRLISAVWDPWRDFATNIEQFRNGDLYTLRRITPAGRR
jgi:3-oxoacyl-[acyl-carrier protein] reductase